MMRLAATPPTSSVHGAGARRCSDVAARALRVVGELREASAQFPDDTRGKGEASLSLALGVGRRAPAAPSSPLPPHLIP